MRRNDCIRIAFVIDTFDIGGTELNAVRTAEAINRQKYPLTIFHLSKDGPLKPRYHALGCELVHLPISNLYSLGTAAQGNRFAGLLRQHDIQVIHTHDVYTNSFAIPWARLRTRCAALASRRWTEEVPRPALKTINRVACSFAHRILANSSSVADYLVENEKVSRDRIEVLPNFISTKAFSTVNLAERQGQRAAWGLPSAVFAIGCVSRLAPVKNHQFLIRALAILPEEFHLVLIGDGSTRRELESLALQLGVGTRVHFVGEVISDINLHQFFDVSVLVSRSEGFPNSLVEALAAGCAVVATPVGGIPDLIRNEQTGLIVEQDNVEMLAGLLARIRQDPTLSARLGAAGREIVRRNFHEEVVIAQLSSLYERLAERVENRRQSG